MRDNRKSIGSSIPREEQPRKFKKGDVVLYVKGQVVRKSKSRKVIQDGQQLTVGDPGPINLGGDVGAVRLPDNFVDMVGCTWKDTDGKVMFAKFLENELLPLGV
ncbi:hypothetical protein [Pseudomonas sp. TNT2022 ID642]|uniref:hypothetical protein n=1 Tax=Pseudomonas sp. TNT2022 ID642 TaxID=2942632 RepID=UPI00235E352E|nr:hypothetical protein [Pseudomonas sp. TNT2022 ID642]MDD1002381.1 hypothetical protein [Pseudomonas sp. TNT2022 ID642]